MLRSFFLFTWIRFSPSKRISEPSLITAVSARSLRIDMEVTLFPLPDSPTTPRISPGLTEKLMPRTACTSPLLVINEVFKFLISITGSILRLLLFQLRIQRVTQSVSDKIKAKHDQTDYQCRNKKLIRTGSEVLRCIITHGTKACKRRLQTDSKIT